MSQDFEIHAYIAIQLRRVTSVKTVGPPQCNSTHAGCSSRKSDQARVFFRHCIPCLFSPLWDFACHRGTLEQGQVVAGAAFPTKGACDRVQLFITCNCMPVGCCLYTNKVLHLILTHWIVSVWARIFLCKWRFKSDVRWIVSIGLGCVGGFFLGGGGDFGGRGGCCLCVLSCISGVHHSFAFPAISLGFTILLLLCSKLYLWGSPFFFRLPSYIYISGVHHSSFAFPAISLGFTSLRLRSQQYLWGSSFFFCVPSYISGSPVFCVPNNISGIHTLLLLSQLYCWASPVFFCLPGCISGLHHPSAFPAISGVHHSSAFPAISLGFTVFCIPSYVSGVHQFFFFPIYISGVHYSSVFPAISLEFHHFRWDVCIRDHFLIQPEVVTLCLRGWCMLGVLVANFTCLGCECQGLFC